MKGAEPEFLYLTTVGRRTGQPRRIEIWFTEHAGRYYVIAEHGERAHWVQNLRAERHVRARIDDREMEASARVVDGEREPDLCATIRRLSEKKYGWGDGLVVEVTPGGG